jgi:hypothetical protein
VVDVDRTAGRNDLFARKLLTAAAMIGLVAVLAGVIFNIVSVRPGAEKNLASDEWTGTPAQVNFEKPKHSLVADAEKTITETGDLPLTDIITDFRGTLEIRTSDIVAINAFIKRVIEDNGIFTYATPAGRGKENVYILSCGRRTLSSIMADLENVWHKFDSSVLSIETGSDFERLVVEAVKPRQISEIAGTPTYQSRMKIAENFAFLNNMDESLPGSEFFAAADSQRTVVLNIPKPVLTSSHKSIKKALSYSEAHDVYLTVIVSGANSKPQINIK